MSRPNTVALVNVAYQIFMLALCVYAIGVLAADALLAIDGDVKTLLELIDWFVCGVFFVDFCVTLYRAEYKAKYFFTWGWIDLLSSIPMINALRIGRVARLLRIFRVLRALRATKVLVGHLLAHRAESALFSAATVAFSLIVFSAIAVLTLEQNASGASIVTAEDALWWAVSTVTTVGYGEVYPITSEGRAVAVVLMIGGVGLFAALSGIIAAYLMAPGSRPARTPANEDIDALRASIAALTDATARLRQELAEVREARRTSG